LVYAGVRDFDGQQVAEWVMAATAHNFYLRHGTQADADPSLSIIFEGKCGASTRTGPSTSSQGGRLQQRRISKGRGGGRGGRRSKGRR
jgi:hypothetical protein